MFKPLAMDNKKVYVNVIRAGTYRPITFTPQLVFDGTAKSLAITGTLPAGNFVAYATTAEPMLGTPKQARLRSQGKLYQRWN